MVAVDLGHNKKAMRISNMVTILDVDEDVMMRPGGSVEEKTRTKEYRIFVQW